MGVGEAQALVDPLNWNLCGEAQAFVKLHKTFLSVALVNSYWSRNSIVTIIMTTPQVLWGDPSWHRYPEWACLCSANVVFPGGHKDSSSVREEMRILCVYDAAV